MKKEVVHLTSCFKGIFMPSLIKFYLIFYFFLPFIFLEERNLWVVSIYIDITKRREKKKNII